MSTLPRAYRRRPKCLPQLADNYCRSPVRGRAPQIWVPLRVGASAQEQLSLPCKHQAGCLLDHKLATNHLVIPNPFDCWGRLSYISGKRSMLVEATRVDLKEWAAQGIHAKEHNRITCWFWCCKNRNQEGGIYDLGKRGRRTLLGFS